MLTTEDGNFWNWVGCEICCNFSDVLDRLTVTDDIGAEFNGNALALTPTVGCVGITIAVASLDGVIVVLFGVAEDNVGKGVGVTVTPERLTGLFVEDAEVAVAGINVIDGEEEKLTMGWWPLLLLKSVAVP
jgi:hypothetical protein